LKIALIIFTAYGAGNQYTALLANSLVLKGNSVSVFAPSYADKSHYNSSVKLVKLPLPDSLIKSLFKCLTPSFFTSWKKMIAAEKPDVIHVVFEQRFPYFYISALKGSFPVVTTIHEPKAVPNRGVLANIAAAALQFINNKRLASLSERIIIHGEKLRSARIFTPSVRKKIDVIPLGNFSFLKHNLPEIQPVKDNLLFFGRIVAYKGLKYLIQAAKKAKSIIPGLTVTIAGEGDFSSYREMVKEDDTFTILNYYIPDSKASELFQKAAVVVLPYIDGSQTGIISIASEFHKPVIASDVGNFNDMIIDGETGILIPAADIDAIEKAIIRLLRDDDLRNRMGVAAYTMTAQNLSWDVISKQIIETYQNAVQDNVNHKTKVR
jgi:alpha-maltose-1-phosphate synthase